MPSGDMKTKAKKSIEELERKAKVTEAGVLRAKADVLRLEDRLEKVAVERAGVTVKSAGSKTEAMRLLEELDKERASLERSLSLATGAVGELEAEHEAAEDELSAAQEEEQEARERREREHHRRKLLAVEDALQEARRVLAELPGRPSDRIHRRIATVLAPWFPPNHRPVVPEPPLAKRKGASVNGHLLRYHQERRALYAERFRGSRVLPPPRPCSRRRA